MKRSGLSSAFLAATLFVAMGLRAEPPKDAALAAVPPPSATVAADLAAADAMKSAGADDIFQHFDQLESAHAAAARQEAPRDALGRPTGLGQGMGPGPEAFRQRLLEMFDKNGDGRLDDAERAEARKYAEAHGLGENGAVREQLIKRFDKNGDGKLDATEAAALQKFLQDRQRAVQAKATREAKLDQVAADLAKRRADSLDRANKKEKKDTKEAAVIEK